MFFTDTEDVLKYVVFLREASHLGKMKRTEKKKKELHKITTIPQNFQGFFSFLFSFLLSFLSKILYKRLFMEIEILNKLICFLMIYLPIGWMIHLGKSITPLPLLMKFTVFFSSIPFSSISFLNFCKPFSSIFGLTENYHAENRIFTS